MSGKQRQLFERTNKESMQNLMIHLSCKAPYLFIHCGHLVLVLMHVHLQAVRRILDLPSESLVANYSRRREAVCMGEPSCVPLPSKGRAVQDDVEAASAWLGPGVCIVWCRTMYESRQGPMQVPLA